jgi:hypothetical protein
MEENKKVIMFTDKNNSQQTTNEKASDPTEKKITIMGTSNKYQLKKMNASAEKPINKRVVCKKWFIQPELLTHSSQNDIIRTFSQESFEKYPLIKQQIDSKLSSYRQQDIKKKMFLEAEAIDFAGALTLLQDCQLTCVYCNKNVLVLYENVREPYQWSLDRINNDLGHNKGNLLIACLKCNLHRRRTNMDSFLFTKQMKLVKHSG